MAQWQIKEISDLTQVSTRMLRHYDKLGLLKPSARTESGYRLYSEADLAKLQQINALKFFGFSLSQIKTMLQQKLGIVTHLQIQRKMLKDQVEQLALAQKALEATLKRLEPSGIPDWNDLIILIERYRMNEELKKTWVAQVLTPAEFKQYEDFESSLKLRTDKAAFEKKWANVVAEISATLNNDPKSEVGYNLAKQVMDLLHMLYGKKYAGLQRALWEKGFKAGKNKGEHGLTPEIVHWLDQAIDYYYGQRIKAILKQAETNAAQATELWTDLMEELYGNAQDVKQEELRQFMLKSIMQSDKVSSAAKKWLQQFIGSND